MIESPISSFLYQGTWAFLVSVGTSWPGHPGEMTAPCLNVDSCDLCCGKYFAGCHCSMTGMGFLE